MTDTYKDIMVPILARSFMHQQEWYKSMFGFSTGGNYHLPTEYEIRRELEQSIDRILYQDTDCIFIH